MISCNTAALAIPAKTYRDPSDTTDLAARLSIAERVADCRQKKDNLLAAVALLEGVPVEESPRWMRDPVEACLYIERDFWSRFVEDTGLKSIMSIKTREELDRQLNAYRNRNFNHTDNPLPPFDEPSVYAFFDQICGNMGGMIKDAVKEVFEWLRPCNRRYKTNDDFQIGKKVVLEYMVESYCRRVNYRRAAHVDALGNVLCMLDGKGVRKHPDTLSNLISHAWDKDDTYEDEYLTAKRFGNGNAHITFKRPDLVAKINQSAGDLWLRQQERQASHGFSH